MSRILVVLAAIVSVTAVSAATLEIEVRERGGSALPGRTVCARPSLEQGGARRGARCSQTDPSGKAVIADLVPGAYSLVVDSPADADLIPTLQNRFEVGFRATLHEDGDRVPVLLELERGVPLSIEVRNDHGEFPKGLALRTFETRGGDGAGMTIGLPEIGKMRLVLPPRRFQVGLRHPPSHALVSFEVNGSPVPGIETDLDLAVDRSPRFLTWTLTTGGWVRGHVEFVGSTGCPGRPVARPIPTAREAVDTLPRLVPVPLKQPGPTCDYESWIPPGTWRIAVEGGKVVSSDPPYEDVVLETGGQARVAFRVEVRDEGADAEVHVRVLAPDGKELPRGSVRALSPEDGAVVAEAEPPRYGRGRHVLRGLKVEKTYGIVASHPDWLPATTTAGAVDPERGPPVPVEVTLQPAATIFASAFGIDGAPRSGVRVAVERVDPLPEALRDDAFSRLRESNSRSTDVSGRVALRGFAGGKHRLRARPPEGSGEDVVAEVAEEVTLVEGETKEVEVHLRPAARLVGSIECTGRWPTPANAAIRLYEDSALIGLRGNWIDEKPLLTRDRGTAESFSLGPLGRGAYRLAIEPEGFAYASWASGALLVEEAMRIQVDGPGIVSLGTIGVECGPVGSVRPRSLDLAGVALSDGTLEIEVRPVDGEKTGDPVPVRVDSDPRQFLVRGAPEGEVEIRGRATHPFLVPGTVEFGPVRRTLERGAGWTVDIPFESIGGALEVRTEGAAVRVTAEDGTSRIVPIAKGVASIGGLAPGSWRVERCLDEACKKAETIGSPVRVEALKRATASRLDNDP